MGRRLIGLACFLLMIAMLVAMVCGQFIENFRAATVLVIFCFLAILWSIGGDIDTEDTHYAIINGTIIGITTTRSAADSAADFLNKGCESDEYMVLDTRMDVFKEEGEE